MHVEGVERFAVVAEDCVRRSGKGNGWVTYNVMANKGGTRTGRITAGGQTFTVTQAAPGCSFSISPASQSAGSGGGTFTVGVTAGTSCTWSALSNVAWITVTAGGSGSGNGSVSVNVAANAGTASRTGTVTIAGQRVHRDAGRHGRVVDEPANRAPTSWGRPRACPRPPAAPPASR